MITAGTNGNPDTPTGTNGILGSKDAITRIILSHQSRGLEKIFPFLPESACMNAAAALCRLQRGKIWIVTGFCCFGKGESDGPLGSHFLALALQKMGFTPCIITDSHSAAYFQQAPYPTCCFQTLEKLMRLFETEQPAALIAIERCGRAEDGKYYSMKKKEISELTPPLDELFLQKPARCLSIGIGDGGNEIGMGNYHDLLAGQCDIIPSTVCCDHTIAATVSNWGAYGLMAALEKERETGRTAAYETETETHNTETDGQTALLPSPHAVKAFFRHLLQSGATDGILGPGHPSVDGFPISYDLEIIASLQNTGDLY